MAARRAAPAAAAAALPLLLCAWAGLCFAGLQPQGRRQRTSSAVATALWQDIKGRFRFSKPAEGDDSVEGTVLEKVEGRFRFRDAAVAAMEDATTPEEPLSSQVLEQVDGLFRFRAAAAPEEPLGTTVLENAGGQFRFKAAAAPEETPQPPSADAAAPPPVSRADDAPPEASSRSDFFRNGLILLGAGAVGFQLQLSREAEERERARKEAEERAARERGQGLLPLLPLALVAGFALPRAAKTTSQVDARIKQSKEDAKVEKTLGTMFANRFLRNRTYDS